MSLLCSNGFNVAAQLPAGLWMTSREECEGGARSWYDICTKEIPTHPGQFKERVRTLFKWFYGATTFDKNAILEFPPVLSASQRKDMHTMGTQMGLAHNSYGPKHERRLLICSNLQALKNIQKRGGVQVVASASVSSPAPRPVAARACGGAPPASCGQLPLLHRPAAAAAAAGRPLAAPRRKRKGQSHSAVAILRRRRSGAR
jgi:hypothetical protein